MHDDPKRPEYVYVPERTEAPFLLSNSLISKEIEVIKMKMHTTNASLHFNGNFSKELKVLCS